MQYQTSGVAIYEFIILKPKMYSFLVDNSAHKKAIDLKRNFVATICYSEYKYLLLNNKC